MKDNSNRSTAKAARKAAANHLEQSVISSLKAAAAKLGHDSKSLTKKIEKEAKKLSKKLAKEFTTLKNAAADETNTLLNKAEPKEKKSEKSAVIVAAPTVKSVKAAKTVATPKPVIKPMKDTKAPIPSKKTAAAKASKTVN